MILPLLIACDRPGTPESRDSDPLADSSEPEESADTAETADTGHTDDTDETAAPPDLDGDGAPDGEDCDPADPHVFPGAEEWCDLVDHDCDGDPLPEGVCGKPQRVEALAGAIRIGAPDHLGYMALPHFLGDMDGEPGEELGIETATPTSWDPTQGYYTLAVLSWPLPGDDTTLTEAATSFLVSYGGEDVRHWLPAGDFDGDGYNDLVMVSYGYFYDGYAYLVRGPITAHPGTVGVDAVAAAWWGQLAPGDAFGYDADAGGDVNGDGLTDILVSSELNEQVQTLLLYGRNDGLAPGMDTTIETANVGDGGEYVQFSGDQDGDGMDDLRLMAGALLWVPGGEITPYSREDWGMLGRSFRVAGTTGCSGVLSGAGQTPRLGDWDGDGFDDLLVDCNDARESADGDGDGYLFVSGATLPDATSDAELPDLATGSWNMETLHAFARKDAGDLDGDGATDLLLIARDIDTDDDDPNTTRATTYVLLSSDGPPDPWTDPTQRGFALGSELYTPSGTYTYAVVGDADGDGLADFAATTHQAGGGAPSEAWIIPNWGIPWDDPSLF